MPDGGFVAAWTNSYDAQNIQSWGCVYGPDGQARGPAFPVDADSWVLHVAANPRGGVAATGYRWHGPSAPAELWVRRFADDGTFVGESLTEAATPGATPEGDLAFDAQGDLWVVWSEYPGDRLLPLRGRGFDPAGNPLGPAFQVSDDPAYRPRTARVHDSSFVTVWYGNASVRANVVSLCTPGVAVCGDGVVVPQCEECDDGAANSDRAPDACRTDCRRAHCGDRVVDSGEQCDDGNVVSGDCCSASCQREPDTDGDGVCDPSDDCPIFPDPDQTAAGVCSPASYEGLDPALEARFDEGLDEFADIETPDRGLGPVFNRRRVAAFTDLLLHDMGSLGDGIEQGDATGSEFRTAPLWGVAQSAPYLHDGRASTLDAAIAAHDGEAKVARNRFLALAPSDRTALIAFLRAL